MLLFIAGCTITPERRTSASAGDRLITLEPGHFHAALLQQEMLPGVSRQADVYASLGPDLSAHLARIERFNARKENPTAWELEIHTGGDPFERMLKERPGNVVVMSGRNLGKIERVHACIRAGLAVLADKPWIIEPEDLPELQEALDEAERTGVAAYDGMTQRFEISCLLPRQLARDRDVFGSPVAGTPDDPGARMESVHYLLKKVAGAPNLRPAWFFDIRQQGEGLTDVGTHLVDLVKWTLFPDQVIDWRADIRVLDGRRWPTTLSREQYRDVTAQPDFPPYLSGDLKDGRLEYFCNNTVRYTIRGIHTRLDVKWDYEAAPGSSDTEFALFRGDRSRIEVRQGKEQNYRPEVFVVPNKPSEKPVVLAAVGRRVGALQAEYPGIAAVDAGREIHIVVPDALRIGHEAHFGLLTRRFFEYFRDPKRLPAWEKPNMMAKYYVTTKGVELARHNADAK
jgi:predicted dehydrogenase